MKRARFAKKTQFNSKAIDLEIDGIRVWVDYDDVDPKEAKAVARRIVNLYNLASDSEVRKFFKNLAKEEIND